MKIQDIAISTDRKIIDINFDGKLKAVTDIASKLTFKIVTEGQND